MSKIEVNEIDAQSGSTITVGSACKSVAVPGNVVKTNAVQASDAGNIISQSGTTITIGASGDTVSLASGASQSGFGRTGTVDWQTGSIKTSTFTAASGEGYFVDTSSAAVTANLPAGSAGAIVSFSDYTRTFGTNNLIITPNGSEKIGGVAASVYLNVNGQAITLVYVDGTEGWINIQNAEDTETGVTPGFISASGGTETNSPCGDFKSHIFTGPGTFTVSSVGNAAGSNSVEYLVVAGGGGGGFTASGGGGAGGARENYPSPSTAGLPVSAQAYPITVGGGGGGSSATPGNGSTGSNSIFSTITSAGGGGGASGSGPGSGGTAQAGGSGGGGAGGISNSGPAVGGAGNTPPVSPPQGNPGGTSTTPAGAPVYGGSGGGGACAAGTAGSTTTSGNGGTGLPLADTFFGPTAPSYGTPGPVSSTRYFAGGGGGSGDADSSPRGAQGGAGGGGAGGIYFVQSVTGATTNTGGGGGGADFSSPTGGSGGSGIVVIRYKFQ
jgi:hypothetical protein|tara:strand:- start:1965 stop:3455 length:1491 start_codon:yes stop_codon:yes gene_type:complete